MRKGRIRQAIAHWPLGTSEFKWELKQTCEAAKELGCVGIDLLQPADWPLVREYGLICTSTNSSLPYPVFMRGINNPRYHDELMEHSLNVLRQCKEGGVTKFVVLVGYKWNDADDPSSGEISLEDGMANSLKALRILAPEAEKAGVTLCVEHLNTRDDTHPMKGHPGYQGDNLDYVVDMVRRANSPAVKLLFDIYHVSVMHGDLIRRIHQCKDVLGHVHTAGNPGRGELDARQEINFPAVLEALLDVGYDGYVAHEYIPTREPMQGLREAVELCDV